MLAYLDDVATTVTDNVVTVPLSTEEIEIIATDLEHGLISSYTFINNVTQTQYADFTIAVPSGVTVSGTTITGTVTTNDYTITVTPDPVASTVTAKIDNVETTVTANAFAVPVSATSVEITVVADGYVSATKTYTNTVTKVLPLVAEVSNESADDSFNIGELSGDYYLSGGSSTNTEVRLIAKYLGNTVTSTDVLSYRLKLYVYDSNESDYVEKWTGWITASKGASDPYPYIYVPVPTKYPMEDDEEVNIVTAVQLHYFDWVEGINEYSPEYIVGASGGTRNTQGAHSITASAVSGNPTVTIDNDHRIISIEGASTDTVKFTVSNYGFNYSGTSVVFAPIRTAERSHSVDSNMEFTVSLSDLANYVVADPSNSPSIMYAKSEKETWGELTVKPTISYQLIFEIT